MSNAKHTPGPWIATKMGYIVTADRKNSIAVTNSANDDADKANARLIAAAPELLAALSDLLAIEGIKGDRSVAINKAFAAIAKAKGE